MSEHVLTECCGPVDMCSSWSENQMCVVMLSTLIPERVMCREWVAHVYHMMSGSNPYAFT